MTTFTFTLPMPPSANRYWRKFRGRIIVSEEAKKYKEMVKVLAKAKGVTVLDGDILLKLEVYFNRRNGDVSNRIKILEDALIGVAYHDDQQTVLIHAERYLINTKHDKRTPFVKVTIQNRPGKPTYTYFRELAKTRDD